MTSPLDTASRPGFIRTLVAFDTILEKAEAFCEAKKIEDEVILNLRLAPDMLPFSRQIGFVADYAVKAIARLAQEEPPATPETGAGLKGLRARLAAALDYVKAMPAEKIAGAESREVTFGVGPGKSATVPASHYLFQFTLPNFYFHATAAYAILRHNGVDVGKRDFLGDFL